MNEVLDAEHTHTHTNTWTHVPTVNISYSLQEKTVDRTEIAENRVRKEGRERERKRDDERQLDNTQYTQNRWKQKHNQL